MYTIRNDEVKKMRNRIAEVRGNIITQQELADRIGVTRPYLSRVENGASEPGGEIMLGIAKVLGVPVEDIFFLDDVSNIEQEPISSAQQPA